MLTKRHEIVGATGDFPEGLKKTRAEAGTPQFNFGINAGNCPIRGKVSFWLVAVVDFIYAAG